MSAFTTLLALINAQIKTNGQKAITGAKLNGVLVQMVNELGAECQFGGLVLPSTSFTAGDFPVAFLATAAGTYTAFGGAVLDGAFLHILAWDGSAWSDTATDIPAGALEDYAKKDGYYASLTAGAALNLVGRGSVPAQYLFRTTGGTADVGTGSAVLAAIKGRSIVWNQLVQNGNFADGATNWSGNFTVSDGVATVTSPGQYDGIGQLVSLISGHKYYISCQFKPTTASSNIRFGIGHSNRFGSEGVAISLDTITDTSKFTYVSYVGTWTSDGNASTQILLMDFRLENRDSFYIKDVKLIDLTLLGLGDITAEHFEALFPLDYYEPNAGEVLPFAGEKLVTTGFNQWDEVAEPGAIAISTGQNVDYPGSIRSKNYNPCIGGQVYNFHSITTDHYCFWYDAEKNFIDVSYGNTANTLVTAPSNACYFRIRIDNYGSTTYQNNICINLSWSGIRNGEYEPYEKHELAVNPATLLDKDGNLVFPYGGMHGVGTAFDLMKPEADGFIHYANRVFARVNLGDLNWTYYTGGTYPCFVSSELSKSTYNILPGSGNLLTSKGYTPIAGDTRAFSIAEDKIIHLTDNITSVIVEIKDSAYTDGAAFKAAMDGVYLYYEVATPEVVELAEPIAASYYANDWGTEEWQPANGSEPYTAPCNVDVQYAMNAVDTLRNLPRNYIGAEDFDAYNTALAAALASVGITMTYARTFNEQTDHHEFTITMAQSE